MSAAETESQRPGRHARVVRRRHSAVPISATEVLIVGSDRLQAVVPHQLAAALAHCLGVDTIQGHARSAAQALGVPASHLPALEQALEGLAARGHFHSVDDHPGASVRPPPITTLGLLTRDRPAAVQRCLASHLRHFQEHGRTLDVAVVDSSAEEPVREATAAALRGMVEPTGARLRLASVAARRRFAQRLAEAAGVPGDIVDFALSDVTGCGHDTGANRNALLLGLAGQLLLSSDDDVICEPHQREPAPRQLAVTGAPDPTRMSLFADLPQARAAAVPAEQDLLGAHEALLGWSVTDALREATPDGVVFSGPWTRIQPLLAEGSGRVAVTSSGLLGDSGARYPVFYAWSKPDVIEQLRDLGEDGYRDLIESRQMWRAVGLPTVTPGPFLMSTHVGVDARSLIPPFFPVLRGQDLAFGSMLRLAAGDPLIGHVPQAVLHVPAERRRSDLGQLWPPPGGPSLVSILSACLRRVGQAIMLAPGGADRFRLAGQLLQQLVDRPGPQLEDLIRTELVEMARAPFTERLRHLGQPGAASTRWGRDLRALHEQQVRQLADADVLLAADLRDGRTADQARALGKQLLSRFGGLLEAWPRMFAAALALNQAGQGLFDL